MRVFLIIVGVFLLLFGTWFDMLLLCIVPPRVEYQYIWSHYLGILFLGELMAAFGFVMIVMGLLYKYVVYLIAENTIKGRV